MNSAAADTLSLVDDTLCIATDTLSVDTLSLANDSLPTLQTEVMSDAHGFSAEPAPYQLWRDNWVTGTLLLAFIIIVFLINHTRHQFLLQAKNFLYTPTNAETPFAKDITFNSTAVLLMVLLLSLLGGFMTYVYTQCSFDLSLCTLSPYILLFTFTGCFLLYFLVKAALYRFVDWVFFTKTQHKLWLSAYSFVISLECLLFFPIVLIFVYFNLSIQQAILTLFAVLVLLKLLLAYKCFSIFFPYFYCLFHFFSYLCALEVVPLITLWQFIAFVTGHLIIR